MALSGFLAAVNIKKEILWNFMALSGFLAAVNIKKEFYGFPKFQVSG
jgi:hypothetical protein